MRFTPPRCLLGILLVLAHVAAGRAAASEPVTPAPVQYWVAYAADLLANVHGGLRTGTAYLDYFELGASMELGEVGGLGRIKAQVSGFATNSARFSERYAGDAMTVSSIDNGYALQLLEAWTEMAFGSGARTTTRFGLYDLNSEFDNSEARSLFVNSAHGIGHEIAQTGLNGPSIFPSTALAARFAWQPQDSCMLRLAVADAVPGSRPGLNGTRLRVSSSEGVLWIAQGTLARGKLTQLSLGHWQYTRGFERLPAAATAQADAGNAADGKHGNHGTYLTVEVAPGESNDRTWQAFGRVGYADPHVNEFDLHVATGAVADLPWPARRGSQLGLAWQQARLSDRHASSLAAAGFDTDPEQNVELTWRVPIGDHLVLQPDLQYVIDPAADRRASDAWVVGLRFELAAAG